MDKEKAKLALKHLIEYTYDRYKNNKDFVSNEKQISKSLIEPFIRDVLGWDVDSPSEFKVEVPASGKRVDVLICLNGITQFIVETKSLTHDIVDNAEFYKQTLSYAHSKEKTFAILTNFRHFVILRCDVEVDNPLKAAIKEIDIENYRDEELDFLYNFSKKVWVEKGEENPLYSKLANFRKRTKVDVELLEDLKEWRQAIINNIKKHPRHNKYDFSDEKERYYIEEEIQRFIDRLIFVCYTEDKGFVDSELKSLIELKKDKYYASQSWLLQKIRAIFKKYWSEYNSDLFKFGKCDEFFIDDEIILKILIDLRKPKDRLPYDFGSIEADILGKTYENFIGHVIAGEKRFKEKESKGKRKSEGIYYTPTYIVDYIVRNTVSQYIKGKSFASINKVRILDPACGSGSFLIKAFDALVEESESIVKRKLSYEEKKDLMLNCIFGVDKDERAVDICKLNLSLKLAERGQKLPELHNNIKCGDSLIDDKEIVGYKAFKWEEEFKEIMENGGFDVVVGNPPWVSIKGKHKSIDIPEEQLNYFIKKYNCDTYMPNLYEVFIWRCLSLFKQNGLFSFIVPDRLCANQQFINLRKLILENFRLKKLWLKVHFPEIIADTVVFVIENNLPKSNYVEIAEYPNDKFERIYQLMYQSNSDYSFFYITKNIYNIFKKILSNKEVKPLNIIIESTSGCGAKSNQIFSDRRNARQINILKGESIQRYRLIKKFWFEFKNENLTGRTKDISKLSKKYKVLLRKTGIDLIATFDDSSIYPEQSLYFLYTQNDDNPELLKFLLILLNSKLINCYYRNFAITNRDSTPQLKNIDLDKFPITIPKNLQTFINLADKMLSLNKKLQEIGDKNTLEKQKIQEEIKKTDNEIDELVYQLYGITEEEKKIIEESLK